jgi:AraC-like DNA-binding protein
MEWSRVHSRADLPGVELLHAHFVHHRYARHAHESAVIGLVESGVQSYFYRGTRYRTGPGGIFIVNAEEGHTGESGDPEGYTYRALYPTTALLRTLIVGDRNRDVRFREPVIYDRSIWSKLRGAHLSVEQGKSSAECEAALLEAISALLLRNGDISAPCGRLRAARHAIRRVCALIDADPARCRSLADLAGVAHMSPYHFAHVFSRETGLPVHQYAETARIRHAKTMLRQGSAIAKIALELGFADQSHFTRRYKRIEGVTPGQYQKNARSFKPE